SASALGAEGRRFESCHPDPGLRRTSRRRAPAPSRAPAAVLYDGTRLCARPSASVRARTAPALPPRGGVPWNRRVESIAVKSAVETLEPTRAKLTVEVSYEELKPSIDHAYSHIAEQVNVPGFRKGKVPARIIDQRVGRAAVIEHAVNDALPGLYRDAVAETGIKPLGQP